MDLFEATDYRSYLKAKLGDKSRRAGLKGSLAKALDVHSTFVSQLLNGSANLSLDQAHGISEFFAHSPEETHFFLLLVQRDRASTEKLRSYFQKQLATIIQQRIEVIERLGREGSVRLNPDLQNRYYSDLNVTAVHMALTIPRLRDRSALSQYLGLGLEHIGEIMGFLKEAGLIAEDKRGPVALTNKMRIGKESSALMNLHTNLRLRAIQSLPREKARNDLHYSGVWSLSTRDALRLREKFLRLLEEIAFDVMKSPEEELYAYSCDFFSMRS